MSATLGDQKELSQSSAQQRLDARIQELARQKKVIMDGGKATSMARNSPRSHRSGPKAPAPRSDIKVKGGSPVAYSSVTRLRLDGQGQLARKVPLPKYPKMEGWLEKRGQVFWNMRYFQLKKNVLIYHAQALVKGAPVPPPNGVVHLDTAVISLSGDVLSIKTPVTPQTHFLSKLKGDHVYRVKHRDIGTLQTWHATVIASQEVHRLHRLRAAEEAGD